MSTAAPDVAPAANISRAAVTDIAPPSIPIPSATGVDANILLAGPGARAIAFVIDFMIRSALALAWLLAAALAIFGNVNFDVDSDNETLWYLVGATPAMAIYFLYHLVLEPLMAGRTPGKRMTGLRVLTTAGVAPSAGALLVRNVFRIVDSMPVFYVVGLSFVMFGRRHVRLGDLAAGTVLAVERAPFLESLDADRGEPAKHRPWREARERAAALSRRHGSDVPDALHVVADYRAAARELGAARRSAAPDAARHAEHLEAVYSDLHDVIHRPARQLGRALLELFRDRLPAALGRMRLHLLAVSLLFVTCMVTGAWLVFTYPDLIAMFADPKLIATVERGELWTDGLLNVTPSAVLSVSILTNNIVVSLFAFCSGIVFGLGTFYLVGMNGLSLGAIFAVTGQHGL
ncbi:MAG TPA: RDD family protein, partial [Steroidobacteraceae bacterium]|nr:RDD family protein [Steroidobacteraceae bacterium]